VSDFLPLFPLPSVVLFPNVFLPLHIFEPRYREMVADAVASDRMIGMVLLRPGWQQEYEKRPPVYPVGCSGVIAHFRTPERRPLQRDLRRGAIPRGGRRPRRSYRRGVVRNMVEGTPPATGDAAARSTRSAARTDCRAGRPAVRRATAMNDADLVNALAQYLDLDRWKAGAARAQLPAQPRQSLVELSR
jgi:hypothetical protein